MAKNNQPKITDTDGPCPRCKEWTVAEESCCGMGAIVQGDVLDEETAREMLGLDPLEN